MIFEDQELYYIICSIAFMALFTQPEYAMVWLIISVQHLFLPYSHIIITCPCPCLTRGLEGDSFIKREKMWKMLLGMYKLLW